MFCYLNRESRKLVPTRNFSHLEPQKFVPANHKKIASTQNKTPAKFSCYTVFNAKSHHAPVLSSCALEDWISEQEVVNEDCNPESTILFPVVVMFLVSTKYPFCWTRVAKALGKRLARDSVTVSSVIFKQAMGSNPVRTSEFLVVLRCRVVSDSFSFLSFVRLDSHARSYTPHLVSRRNALRGSHGTSGVDNSCFLQCLIYFNEGQLDRVQLVLYLVRCVFPFQTT